MWLSGPHTRQLIHRFWYPSRGLYHQTYLTPGKFRDAHAFLFVEAIQLDDPDNVFNLVYCNALSPMRKTPPVNPSACKMVGFSWRALNWPSLPSNTLPLREPTIRQLSPSNPTRTSGAIGSLTFRAAREPVMFAPRAVNAVMAYWLTLEPTTTPKLDPILPTLGRPLALGTQGISVTNTGSAEVLVTVQLTNDGIPETSDTELPGMNGVFFLGDFGCARVGAGETLTVPGKYRPSTAGQHFGEVVVAGLGAPIYVNLTGRVVGPHICFETEDDVPDDSTLQFGVAPSYTTAQNVSETRSITMTNCGYEAELTLDSISFAASSSSEFTSVSVPWDGASSLAVGE